MCTWILFGRPHDKKIINPGHLPLRLSSIDVVIHWGSPPLRLSFIEVVFHWGNLPLRSASIEVAFHGSCFPWKVSSFEVVFLWGCLTVRLSSFSNQPYSKNRAGVEFGNYISLWNVSTHMLHTYNIQECKQFFSYVFSVTR